MRALVGGRFHASNKDIEEIVRPALRHRLILNFEAEADRVDPDDVVRDVLKGTPHEPRTRDPPAPARDPA